MSNGPSIQKKGFSVIRTTSGAYAFVFRHWRTLVALGTLPMLASFVVNTVAFALRVGTGSLLWIFSGLLIAWVILSSFAVSWHRFVLLGEKAANAPFHFSFGPREGRYFLYILLTLLPFSIAMALQAVLLAQAQEGPPSKPLTLLVALFAIAGLVVTVRLSLVFPAIAVDAGYGFRQAWSLTKEAPWRLLLLMILTLLPGKLLAEVILLTTVGIGPHLISAVMAFVGGSVLITAFSLAFRQLAGAPPQGQPMPPSKPWP